MKINSLIYELLKLFGALFVGWVIWLIIFSMAAPADAENIEPFRGAIALFGAVTGLIVSLVMKFNSINNLKQKARSSFNSINILIKRSDSLLEKANKVADKYMKHESDVLVGIAKERKPVSLPAGRRITSASQFQAALENYPDLKANESIMELLRQIRESENAVANAKIGYNEIVEKYNTSIHTFPGVIIKAIARYKDESFFEETVNDIISDEELGI